MKEIYVSLSAAVAQERNLAIVANNLANVNSSGFKRETAIFEVLPPKTDMVALAKSASPELGLPMPVQTTDGIGNYMRIAETSVDYAHGDLRPTTEPLDMALQESDPKKGLAFFTVETPQGDLYTRAGGFQINKNKELVTVDGFRVKGTAGPISVDSGPIEVTADGGISAKGRALGSLKIAYFDRPQDLEKVGSALFSDRSGAVASRAATPQDGVSVRQGYLEMSNVNAVAELTKMIETQRAYTSYEKSIQAIDNTSEKVINQAMGN